MEACSCGQYCGTIKAVKEPETPSEYDRFKALLGRVLAVPHSVIMKREAEYQRQSKLNPNRRGPKPKQKRAGRDAAV
jgi:hypothetical protein